MAQRIFINSIIRLAKNISKYLINSDGYVADRSISEKNNSILDIRKELFNLKRNGGNMKTIYENLKKEVRYKKFNFLIY